MTLTEGARANTARDRADLARKRGHAHRSRKARANWSEMGLTR
jgi:hypothetical protein